MSAMTVSPAMVSPFGGRGQQDRTRHLSAVPARPQSADAPLALTRRGRLAITLLATVVLVGGGVIGAQSALAGDGATSAGTATVVVQPGESLWSIAGDAVPGADRRDVIIDIQQLNGLSTSQVSAGQSLIVPAG